MNPTKTILEIRFSSPARQFDFISDIVRALGGTPPADNRNIFLDTRNIGLQVSSKKINLLFNASRYVINMEEQLDLDEIRKTILDLSARLHSHVHWTSMTRIGFRTIWTLEVENFEALLEKSKKALFKDHELITNATDVGLPLTLIDRNSKVNYLYGPMKKAQLEAIGFEFPLEVPECFAYIDVDYYREPNQQFSEKYLKDFLRSASSFATEKVQETRRMLGV